MSTNLDIYCLQLTWWYLTRLRGMIAEIVTGTETFTEVETGGDQDHPIGAQGRPAERWK